MKINRIIIIAALTCLLLTGCTKTNTKTISESIKQLELTGNLVTLQAHYHNVIEYTKEKESGILHMFDKDRVLFAEYNGSIKLGIDLSKVKFESANSKIKVTLPKADVIGEPTVDKENFKSENFIESEDTFLNGNEITMVDSNKALEEAQSKMKESAQNDNDLKSKAQMRAKTVIMENIKQVTGLSDKELSEKFEWEYE